MFLLTRTEIEEVPVRSQTAWQLKLTVTATEEGGDPNVFVFQQEGGPEDENPRAWFTCVASPAQLQEYPVGTPAPPGEDGLWQPFFRASEVTLVSRNATDIESLYSDFLDELTLLRVNLEALAHLGSSEEVNP